MKYVAFLRGINVGGKATVPMAELSKTFASLGFQDVSTLLNSGNVCFAANQNASTLKAAIEAGLEKTFSRKIMVMIRSKDQIAKLIESDPFKTVNVTPQTRLYITFLTEKPTADAATKAAFEPHFQILRANDSEVYSVLTLSESGQTTELMAGLEKAYGKNVTTRNWNTVMKIGDRLA